MRSSSGLISSSSKPFVPDQSSVQAIEMQSSTLTASSLNSILEMLASKFGLVSKLNSGSSVPDISRLLTQPSLLTPALQIGLDSCGLQPPLKLLLYACLGAR